MMTYQKIRSVLIFVLLLISLSFVTKSYAIHFESLNVIFLNHTKKDSILFKYSFNDLDEIPKIEIYAFKKSVFLKDNELKRIKNLKIKSIEFYEFSLENNKYDILLKTDSSYIIVFSMFQKRDYSFKILNRDEYFKEKRNKKYYTIKKLEANVFVGLALEPILIKADFKNGGVKELMVNSFKKTTHFSEKELSSFTSYNISGFDVDKISDYFGRKYYKMFYIENGERSFSIDLYQNGKVSLMHKGEMLVPPPINTPYPIKNK